MEKHGFGPYQCAGLARKQLQDKAVLQAMSRVPRHRFLPEELVQSAYDDRALPIGYEQTISQPFIVALMSQAAALHPGAKVLEIGTGSGYQAAVLAELGAEVFTCEIIEELAERARATLHTLGYSNVHVFCRDGWQGLPEQAPFDAILITASSPEVCAELTSQLTPKGRLILPLEEEGGGERLYLLTRQGESFSRKMLGAVSFVPLVGLARSRSG